jgi:hypothetical protein
MTKPDFDDFAAEPSDGAIILRRAALGIGGGIALIFMAGMIAGFSGYVIENGGFNLKAAGILGAMLLVTGGIAYGIWRLWPGPSNEPVAPRVLSARRIMIAAFVLSLPIGIMLAMADNGVQGFLSDAPVSSAFAATVIAFWLIAGPVLTWLWWRQIDEHEAGAYRDGALVAVHAYIFVAPAWWMATRAGWLPPQEPMLVVLAVCVLWSVVWFVRRYF